MTKFYLFNKFYILVLIFKSLGKIPIFVPKFKYNIQFLIPKSLLLNNNFLN